MTEEAAAAVKQAAGYFALTAIVIAAMWLGWPVMAVVAFILLIVW